MTFDELPIYIAVCEVRRQMTEGSQSPGSEDWATTDEGRIELTRRVWEVLIKDADQRFIDIWILVRKSQIVDGRKKAELTAEVANLHGSKCFYAGRGKGDCSPDAHLDRILPGTRGGKYTPENCLIACGKHNAMRGDQSIEAFLSSGV